MPEQSKNNRSNEKKKQKNIKKENLKFKNNSCKKIDKKTLVFAFKVTICVQFAHKVCVE